MSAPTPSEISDLQRSIDYQRDHIKMLEQEVAALTLEQEKHQDEILEHENWIFLINSLQSNPSSSKINDIDRALTFIEDLKAENISLIKELSREIKKQSDIRKSTTEIIQNQNVEKEEFNVVSVQNIEHAIKTMNMTETLLGAEQQKLGKENSKLISVLIKRPICGKIETALNEIRELKIANKTIELLRKQAIIYYESVPLGIGCACSAPGADNNNITPNYK